MLHPPRDLDCDYFDFGWKHQSGNATPPGVALAGEVVRPDVEILGNRKTDSLVPPTGPEDAEVGGVQVQVTGGVVVLPDTAAFSLTQDVAAEHGSCCHVGNVRVESGLQIVGQILAGSLQGEDELTMKLKNIPCRAPLYSICFC